MNKLLAASVMVLLMSACQDDKGTAYVQTVQASQLGITAIAIDQTDEIILEDGLNQSYQLSATASSASSDQDYSDKATWSSSSPTVATVSSSGNVSAVGVGVTTITASFAQFSDHKTVTVSDAELVSITLDPATVEVDECLGTTVSATGNYDDGTTGRVVIGLTWSTADAAVASVASVDNANVNLLSHKSGTTTLTATREQQNISADATVNVAETLTSISLSETTVDLTVGESSTLRAQGSFSDGNSEDVSDAASWSLANSNQSAYVTLSNSSPTKGKVTGVSSGSAVITAECGDTVALESTTVNVTEAAILQSVSFTEDDEPWNRTTDDSPSQLTLEANYSDGSAVDVTDSATWEIISGDSEFIFVSNSSSDKGEITFASNIDEITEVKSVIIRATYEDEDEDITVRVLVPSS